MHIVRTTRSTDVRLAARRSPNRGSMSTCRSGACFTSRTSRIIGRTHCHPVVGSTARRTLCTVCRAVVAASRASSPTEPTCRRGCMAIRVLLYLSRLTLVTEVVNCRPLIKQLHVRHSRFKRTCDVHRLVEREASLPSSCSCILGWRTPAISHSRVSLKLHLFTCNLHTIETCCFLFL